MKKNFELNLKNMFRIAGLNEKRLYGTCEIHFDYFYGMFKNIVTAEKKELSINFLASDDCVISI